MKLETDAGPARPDRAGAVEGHGPRAGGCHPAAIGVKFWRAQRPLHEAREHRIRQNTSFRGKHKATGHPALGFGERGPRSACHDATGGGPAPSNPSPFLVARTELGVSRRAGLLAGALLVQPQAAARCEPRLVRLVASQTDRRLSNLFEQKTVRFLGFRVSNTAACWPFGSEHLLLTDRQRRGPPEAPCLSL